MTADPTFLSVSTVIRDESAWLRRLARALTADAASADDAVQETWLAGLIHPPREATAPGGWLRTVLRNVVRKQARGESRRRAREQAALRQDPAQDQNAPAAEELALRWEAHRRVADLVRALDEPYRSTVLLAYHEGLAPTEIARRLGIPAGTVRWRLKQALDRLRAALDRSDAAAPPAQRWRALLLPLPALKHPARDAGLTTTALGGGLMAAKATKTGIVLIGILLLLLGGTGLFLLREAGAGARRGGGRAANLAAPVGGDEGAGKAADPSKHPLGVYQKGARTPVPRFAATAKRPDAGPPAFRNPPRLVKGEGPGPRHRYDKDPPNWPELQRKLNEKLEAVHVDAQRCLEAGFSADDPGLGEGMLLGIEADARGLMQVWIGDRKDVPTGPLACFSEAVYGIDWSGLTTEPATITTYIHYQNADGGAAK